MRKDKILCHVLLLYVILSRYSYIYLYMKIEVSLSNRLELIGLVKYGVFCKFGGEEFIHQLTPSQP